jgi:hypothetical protein
MIVTMECNKDGSENPEVAAVESSFLVARIQIVRQDRRSCCSFHREAGQARE